MQQHPGLPLGDEVGDLAVQARPVAVAVEGAHRRGHPLRVVGHGDADPLRSQVQGEHAHGRLDAVARIEAVRQAGRALGLEIDGKYRCDRHAHRRV